MGVPMLPLRIGWAVNGSAKWGWDIVLFDPKDHENSRFCILPESLAPFSWASPDAARTAAVTALRDLADRIERGEP